MSESVFKNWIGKQLVESDVLSQGHIDRFLATINCDQTRHHVAPHLVHWSLFPELCKTSDLGRDGHYIDQRLFPPVGDYRRMWGANDLCFHQPLCSGDEIKRTSTVTDVFSKRGQSGDLIFVIITHEFDVDGANKLTDKQTLLYREGVSALDLSVATKVEQDTQWQFQQVVTPDPVLLFRYSAITFNGHRIHYDRDYVKNTEKYPDLIVHGPLIATMLLNLSIRQTPSANVSNFSFRMHSPAFVNEPIILAGNCEDEDEIKLVAFTESFRKVASATTRFE